MLAVTREQKERLDSEERYTESLANQEQRFEQQQKQLLIEREKQYQSALAKVVAEHEVYVSRLKSEIEGARTTRDHHSLLAEVESLRTVLEIRGQESLSLRSEVDHLRRELEDKEFLKQRLEAAEARCEDLDAQLRTKESLERQLAQENKLLLEQNELCTVQNERLSQKNEELYWRLRRRKGNVDAVKHQISPKPNHRLTKSLGPDYANQPCDYEESSCNDFDVSIFIFSFVDNI